jgi:hypothetical protein
MLEYSPTGIKCSRTDITKALRMRKLSDVMRNFQAHGRFLKRGEHFY